MRNGGGGPACLKAGKRGSTPGAAERQRSTLPLCAAGMRSRIIGWRLCYHSTAMGVMDRRPAPCRRAVPWLVSIVHPVKPLPMIDVSSVAAAPGGDTAGRERPRTLPFP
jgi:hypothetical protein